jgi:uncharacterized protein YkwD
MRVGSILRQFLCGILACSSLLTRSPSSTRSLPAPDVRQSVVSRERARTDEVLRLVDEERAALGISPLRRVPELDAAAAERAQDMASRDYFAHISPDGVTPGDQIIASGYQALLCGENIASGYVTARDVVDAWMASPDHRANILEARFQDIGLAFVQAPGTESGVLWVQEFGERAADRPARPGLGKLSRTVAPSGRLRQTRMAKVTPSGD